MTTTDYPVRPAIRSTVPLESRDEPTRVHAAGTEGTVVEALGPNAWIVELRIPDDSLEGDAWYEVFELRGDEFELVAPVDDAAPDLGGRIVPLVRPSRARTPWNPDETLPSLTSESTRIAGSG